MNIDILPVKGKEVWPLFAPHHYLTGKYAGHRAWLAVLDSGDPVAFTSIIAAPSGREVIAPRGGCVDLLPPAALQRGDESRYAPRRGCEVRE